MDKELKEPVIPRMRVMKVGEVVSFPIRRYNTVRTAVYHALVPERAEGMNWKIELELANKTVKVTRTS